VIAPVAHFLGEARRSAYGRKPPLILINGLAEQAETWYRNLRTWRRHFDVHAPNILAYNGAALHRRIDADLPVDVDYLIERWHEFVTAFVQEPPYFLVASSMGGKVAVEFALRYPEQVARLVLLCPAGLGDEE
jgi:pimeloyl-ACP methyl ester carboxylesterase